MTNHVDDRTWYDYEYYSWRYNGGFGVLTRPFDPQTEEFDIYDCIFNKPEDAVAFLCDFLGEDEVPDEYALVEITERRVPLPAQL